jgi:hypothetical protein
MGLWLAAENLDTRAGMNWVVPTAPVLMGGLRGRFRAGKWYRLIFGLVRLLQVYFEILAT